MECVKRCDTTSAFGVISNMTENANLSIPGLKEHMRQSSSGSIWYTCKIYIIYRSLQASTGKCRRRKHVKVIKATQLQIRTVDSAQAEHVGIYSTKVDVILCHKTYGANCALYYICRP